MQRNESHQQQPIKKETIYFKYDIEHKSIKNVQSQHYEQIQLNFSGQISI